MNLKFTKMHGAGNDFVFFDNRDQKINVTPELARFLCDRRFGIGADQLLIVSPSESADFRMDIFNADGGEVEMCGNGIRCFAKYVLDEKMTDKTELDIETLAGIIKPKIISDHSGNDDKTLWVRVDMGEPILDGKQIPTTQEGQIIDEIFKLADGSEYKITCVSMGNPHCVIYVHGAVDDFPVTKIGPQIETHSFFPNRTNVEFIECISSTELKQRTWERGSGETYACGTGASAVGVASILNEKTERKMTIHLKGGDLEIEWDETSNHVFMTGPATTVFEGIVNIQGY